MLKAIGLLLFLGNSAWASLMVAVSYIDTVSSPGFTIFNVGGVTRELLCDQFLPNVTTQPYIATVATLADLTGSQLARQGDSQALAKYQEVAILDLQAYANPSLAADVVRAARVIVDGSGPVTPGAAALLSFVQTQNPANYDLSGFQIYANAITQEMTGFAVPEPAAWILFGSGLVAIVATRRRRKNLMVGPVGFEPTTDGL